MPVENYLYIGPTSGVTLDNGDEKMLFTGKPYPFDTEHQYTQVLKKMRYLKPVAVATSEPEQDVKPGVKPKPSKKQAAVSQPEEE